MENLHQLLRSLHGSKYVLWSMQFVASVSIASLFVSYLTGVSLYYSYSYYFSTVLLPLVTRGLERKYVFLLFNGIVFVFLVGFRGRIHDQTHPHYEATFDVGIATSYDDYGLDTIKMSSETDVRSDVEDQSGQDIRETTSWEDDGEGNREESDGPSSFTAEDKDSNDREEVEEGEGGQEDEEEKGETQEEGQGEDKELMRSISSCSDEELNTKFDEFIRKMKEELRLQAMDYHLIPAA